MKNQADKFKKEVKAIYIDEFPINFSENWTKKDEKENEPYKLLYEKEKKNFQKFFQIVKHYLFKDYDGIIRRFPSWYEIFLDEKIVEVFEKDLDPKIVKKEAFEKWEKMDPEKKKI